MFVIPTITLDATYIPMVVRAVHDSYNVILH